MFQYSLHSQNPHHHSIPLGITRGLSRASCALVALLASTTACATAARPSLQTRPEQTSYRETSHYADVIAFLDSLRNAGAPYDFGNIGTTSEGRAIPYVVASRPLVRTAAAARATGKPIVYVQANIHAGEIEGKDALLALLRDLAFARTPNVLDSIVLIAIPIYNADGNERFGPQSRQRTEQNGPELVGQRPNAQGLDLNRDYVKTEAPETRASLAMFTTWDPDVFVDLHTTDGSFHGYALTYAPSLNPASPLGDYTRTLLREVRARVRSREGFEIFDYGNFEDPAGEVSTDTTHAAWYTYDHRPRFGTNYYGLRNRIGILSEAYSHDPLERRVKSTYAFVRQTLSLVAERGAELKSRAQFADAELTSGRSLDIALRSELPKSAPAAPVAFELLARTGDSTRTEPGVPRGMRRTGEIRVRPMPVFDRFEPSLTSWLPTAYAISAADTALLARLRLHGVRYLAQPLPVPVRVEQFVVDTLSRETRPFQGHHEIRLVGHWETAPPNLDGAVLVMTAQPLGRLAAYLLDPESDDGFTTWNAFDASLAIGRPHPVRRIRSADR